MYSLRLNTSYKHHCIIALLVSIWLVAFLVLIAPFDVGDLPFIARLEMMPLYGVITFFAYSLLIPLQKWLYQKTKRWTVLFELVFILLFNSITLFMSYRYYKSTILNGEFFFIDFTLQVFTPIFIILLPMIILARWYASKQKVNQHSTKISLIGNNKLDVLNLELADLICISSADNYVEINYLNDGVLAKKLLRSTLKNMSTQVSDLVKVHRSYLVNPMHIKEWKNTNTIALTQLEVPVSKSYKKTLLDLI